MQIAECRMWYVECRLSIVDDRLLLALSDQFSVISFQLNANS